MKLRLINLPGRDELGPREYWQARLDAMKSAYPWPGLWDDLTVEIYRHGHPDNADVKPTYVGLYNPDEKRLRVFVKPENLDYYLEVLSHECGHHVGNKLHFQYPTIQIEQDLDNYFEALLPETDKGRREDFAEMCGVISGTDPIFFDLDGLQYSPRLSVLMHLAWPVHQHLHDREYRNLRVGSQSVYWEETRTETVTKRVWWWTETETKTESLGWYGFNLAGQLQKYINGHWADV